MALTTFNLPTLDCSLFSLLIQHCEILLFLICCHLEYFFSSGSVVANFRVRQCASTQWLLRFALGHNWARSFLLVIRFRRILLAVFHQRSDWFVIVVELTVEGSFVALLALCSFLGGSVLAWSWYLLLHLFVEGLPSLLKLRPIVTGLFQVFHSILQLPLFS